MLKFKITGLLLMMGGFSFAQNLTYNLQQCIDTALKNNVALRQNGVDVQSANVDYRQAKENLLPSINGNLNYGYNSGRNVDPITNTYTNNQYSSSNASLSASLVLFNGLRLQNFISQNNYTAQAVGLDYQQAKENLVLNVMLAYTEVLNNQDLLEISKSQIEVTQKQVDRMKILVDQGAAGLYELTDIKGQLASENINIISSESSLKQAILNLCQLMNIKYTPDLKIQKLDIASEEKVYPLSSQQLIAVAMRNMPLVKSNELKEKSAEKNIQVIKGGLYPTISLNGSTGSSYSSLFNLATPTSVSEQLTGNYTKNGGLRNPVYQDVQNYSYRNVDYFTQLNNNLGYFVGASVSIPLFNNFRTRNQVKQARLNLNQVKLNTEFTNNKLAQDIEQAWLNMDVAYHKYDVLKDQMGNYEESFRSAEIRFNNGVIDATAFLLTKNKLDNTKVNLTQAGYELIIRKRILDYYKGEFN
ncbi:MAG: TolC family protein [Bacteroidetes bacterium]|nr:TolC family protein [Bacteroidota bacterium]MBU1485576.1 TolC family protein [Bacteroidota bacterium]MBU2268536.1 TolC family protein [Bacteroidota bacterium]MBU2376932.1 TolC family protein [Bacteroidota bacterium]